MYINWKLDPFAVGTNTYLANSEVINAYAFPSFLSDTDMHSESSERVGGTGYWSLANTTLFSNVTEHVNSRAYSFLYHHKSTSSCHQGEPHPLITNRTLKLEVWKISSETKKCMV